MYRKVISIILSFCFFFQQTGLIQAAAAELNLSGYFAKMASNFTPIDSFRPLNLRYFSYDTLNNNFKVLLDKGDFEKEFIPKGTATEGGPERNRGTPEDKLKEETKELLKYFLIGVTLPNDKFWVNLRPDSPSQIIDSLLEETDIGKIMLEADLQLKKDTAQFTSPETPEGREYWDKLYKKAEELYGYQTVEIPTLTRPWIVPGEIIIRETTAEPQASGRTLQAQPSAYIYKATLKVMLEQDYLKDSATYSFNDERSKALNEYSSQLIRELIIPKLTKEVNASKRYAALRQVYYSLILSRWFKERFNDSVERIAGSVEKKSFIDLIDSQNLNNLTSKTDWSKTTYFNAYKKSFAEGEYNIKGPVYTPTGQVIRSYFSGGVELSSSAITPMGYRVTKPLDNFLELLRGNGNVAFSIDPQGNLAQLGSSPINLALQPSERLLEIIQSFNKTRGIELVTISSLQRIQQILAQWERGSQDDESKKVIAVFYEMYEENLLSPLQTQLSDYKGIERQIDLINKSLKEGIFFLSGRQIANQDSRLALNTARNALRALNEEVGRTGAQGIVSPAGQESTIASSAVQIDEAIKQCRGILNIWFRQLENSGLAEADISAAKNIMDEFTIVEEAFRANKKEAIEFLMNFLEREIILRLSQADREILMGQKDKEILLRMFPLLPESIIMCPASRELIEASKLLLGEIKQGTSAETPDASLADKGVASPAGQESTIASSAVEGGEKTGGIDFKNQAMVSSTVYETFGSFAGLDFSLPKMSASAIAGFNLDKEEIEISRLVDNQIIPSGQRIKEFMAASAAKGKFGQRRETVIAWLAKMGMLEETHCCTQEASKEYKEAIVIAESYASI